jgi:hypothetical protein
MKNLQEVKEQLCLLKPTGCIKTLQRAVGCAGKALQRNLLVHWHCVSKHIAKVALSDIACYP